MNNEILISVMTVSLNQGHFIEENILSVLNQTYKNIEHIIVDGGSTDKTLDILKKYSHLKWISEKDSGQSEAYNKGLSLASGDLILCLNSDDYLLNNTVFEDVINHLKQINIEKYSAFMGNLIVVDENKIEIDRMSNRNRDYSFNDLLNILPIVIHPATFFNRNILLQTSGFSNKVHYVMDYDIFLKIAKIASIHSIPNYVSALRRHNASKGCSDDNWKFSWELIIVRSKNGGSLFSKINLQPYKSIIFHILGRKFIDYVRNNKILYQISYKFGITKLNSLTWYDK